MSKAAEAAPRDPDTRGQRATMWLVWIAFTGLSMTVVGWVAWEVLVNGKIWSGASGFALDSMQYLAWVREMSDHFLSANMFSLSDPVRNYWNPALGLSGLLTTLGIPPDWSYSLWIPVGIVMLIWSVTKYVRHITGGGWTAVMAVALALLFTWPSNLMFGSAAGLANAQVEGNIHDFATWDAWPIRFSWGFQLSSVAVSLLCIGLILYERERSSGRRLAPLLALCALLVSWLQPWQGAIFVGLIVVGEFLAPRLEGVPLRKSLRSRLPLIVTTVIAGTAPLAYYALLGVVDANWASNGKLANHYFRGLEWWTPLLVLAPLLLLALTAARQRPKSFGDLLVRLWPLLALAQTYVIAATGIGNTSTHALKGVTIPLAILSAQGLVPWLRKLNPALAGSIGVTLVLLLTVPGSWSNVRSEFQINDFMKGHFVTPDNLRAIDFLAATPEPGGVFSTVAAGSMVPWRTGRQVWIGHETWTPRFKARMLFSDYAMSGSLDGLPRPLATDEFISWTGARFVLDTCENRLMRRAYDRHRAKKDLPPADPFQVQLAPITESVHRFGCATVYMLKPGIKPSPEKLDQLRLN